MELPLVTLVNDRVEHPPTGRREREYSVRESITLRHVPTGTKTLLRPLAECPGAEWPRTLLTSAASPEIAVSRGSRSGGGYHNVGFEPHRPSDPGTYRSSPWSERVRGRLPLLEALRDELYTLLLASAVEHHEIGGGGSKVDARGAGIQPRVTI